MRNEIIQGESLAVLKTLPDEYIQCIVTSPPYYGLRSYLPDEHPDKHLEIGREETPGEYIQKLVEVFREARRVLHPSGTAWINIGDSYVGYKGEKYNQYQQRGTGEYSPVPVSHDIGTPSTSGLKNKDLMMIPARLAIALQSDGWWLRSQIIWEKPNCMPESVSDRPTTSHEYIFLLAKSDRYYYDGYAIAEPAIYPVGSREDAPQGSFNGKHGDAAFRAIRNTRNKRTVWTISPQPYSEAHFATMPPKLIEPCILAGSSSRVCEHCSAPYERTIEHIPMLIRNGPKAGGYGSRTTDALSGTMLAPAETRTIGWQPTCKCINGGAGKSIVLDPFMGSGTVAMVAIRHGRDYLGIELNAEYITLAQKRIACVQQDLWTVEGEVAS